MSTKIHATVDALGNPTGFHLTPGQASDLEGADVLLKDIQADAVLADKAYDAQERVIEPLLEREASRLSFQVVAVAKKVESTTGTCTKSVI